MLVDHRRNLWCPRCSVDAHEVRVRKPDRRRQIVERVVGPDSLIVKRRGDGQSLEPLRTIRSQCDTEVDDPVGVISIPLEIVAQHLGVGMQQGCRASESRQVDSPSRQPAWSFLSHAFGRRVLIQPVMSAITFALSMSLSRSCAGHPRPRGNPASSRVARCAGLSSVIGPIE
jgi:hypothetical protein